MTKDLTTGSPMRLIISFALPTLFGMLFQQLYNMVDAMIVGKLLGSAALAAVGSTGSVNFFVIGFCMGVCNGFAIQIMTMAAAGEGFAFMSTVSEGYAYISKGLNAVFEEEMFDELAPNYKEARMGRGFDCAKYKGDILTIPCGAYPSSATNMWVRACPTWRRTAVVINREEGTITLNCEFKNNKLMVPKAVEEIYFC